MDLATFRARLGRRVGFDGNTARLDGFINDAVQFIHGWRQDWSWARRTTQFQTRTPESGSLGTVTNGSRTVSSLSGFTVTRTGAGISLPDGIVYDVTGGTVAGSLWLTTPYTGASLAGSVAWKLYFNTFPLPPDCSAVEAVIATGSGWEYHLKQHSLTPQHMKRLTTRDYETYPTYYALESANPIPAPWVPFTVADDAGGALAAGTYQHWYCFRNTATGELGPLSDAVSTVSTGGTGQFDLTGIQTLQDYGKRIYRSVVGGSDPLFLTDIAAAATSHLNDAVADGTLGQDTTNREFIGQHPRHGHTQKIRLWPPPDDEYVVSMTYFAAQTELVKTNDVPMLPLRLHQMVLDYAQALYMREQEQHGAASRLENKVAGMLSQASSEQDADPSTVIQIGRGHAEADDTDGGGRWPRHVG